MRIYKGLAWAAVAALCGIAFAMVSCEESNTQGDYVSMNFLEANYYGDFYGNHLFFSVRPRKVWEAHCNFPWVSI